MDYFIDTKLWYGAFTYLVILNLLNLYLLFNNSLLFEILYRGSKSSTRMDPSIWLHYFCYNLCTGDFFITTKILIELKSIFGEEIKYLIFLLVSLSSEIWSLIWQSYLKLVYDSRQLCSNQSYRFWPSTCRVNAAVASASS